MTCTTRSLPCIAAALVCALFVPRAGRAQDHQGHAAAPAEPEWSWSWDAKAFVGWNYQQRKFTDFNEFESQNWIAGSGERRLGRGRFRLHSMLSFEPFTIQPLGSPEVFQTGETYKQAPLIDYQHPHDLFMHLSARYARPAGQFDTFVEVAAVGEPSLGPPASMHRASAADNPTTPLGHHLMDSTHATPGVVKGGVSRGPFGVEGSIFRGLEPDENRKDIDFGPLDSWAARGTWRKGPWDAQFSGGFLKHPEYVEPFFDVTRLTASVGYTRADGTLAAMLGWGENREVHGILDSYLLEATTRPKPLDSLYTRLEWTTRDILGAGGRHPAGVVHFHPLSKVGAATAGYVREVRVARDGRYGIGADVTFYYVAPNLRDNYGTVPVSYHVFLRYRPSVRVSHVH